MPPDDKAPRPQKLSVIVFSGDYDRVHYALAMASAAAATNRAVTLFFTMAATRALPPVIEDKKGRVPFR